MRLLRFRKPRTLGLIIWLLGVGRHPELGFDFYGTPEEYEAALYFQYKFEPIEDEE